MKYGTRRHGRGQSADLCSQRGGGSDHGGDKISGANCARRVVICGGGIMGAATAYYLAEKGLAEAVTVVERVEPACAASGGAELRARGGVRGCMGPCPLASPPKASQRQPSRYTE